MKVKNFICLIVVTLILVACSNVKEESENNIRVQVLSIEKNILTVESLDEGYSGNLKLDKSKANGEDIKFEVGHKILVYYNGQIEGGSEATIKEIEFFEITGKATKEEIEEKKAAESASNNENPSNENSSAQANQEQNEEEKFKPVPREQNKYYSLPKLEITVNGNTKKLKDNESALIHELSDMVEWESGLQEINPDYKIFNNNVSYEFDSKQGIINDTSNDIHVKLHNELVEVLLLALKGDL